MVRDQHLPVGTGKMANALTPPTVGIQHRLGAGLAVGVGTGIDGIGQHVVNGRVTRVDPAHLVALVYLQRKRQTFRPEPEPDTARRTRLGKFGEHAANRRRNRFVWVEPHFAIGVAPDKAHWQAAPEFAARGLVRYRHSSARAVREVRPRSWCLSNPAEVYR